MSDYWNRMAISFAMIVNGIGCGKAIERSDWLLVALHGAAILVLLIVLHFASIAAAILAEHTRAMAMDELIAGDADLIAPATPPAP